MELDKDEKIFLGSCLIVYLLVMAFVGIYEPSSFLSLVIKSTFVAAIALLVGYMVA